jgi:hypothetical protein
MTGAIIVIMVIMVRLCGVSLVIPAHFLCSSNELFAYPCKFCVSVRESAHILIYEKESAFFPGVRILYGIRSELVVEVGHKVPFCML